MASKDRHHRPVRSAVQRIWLHCLFLALPAVICGSLYLRSEGFSWTQLLPALLLLALYLLFVCASLVENIIRPVQTLSNVIASLREGDYSFRARGARSSDALGELAGEVNALADLLQRQRVRSLEATALLARILEVMHTPLFAFDRNNVLQLVNDAGVRLLGLPHARCFGRTAQELGLDAIVAAPDQSLHAFTARSLTQAASTRWLLRKAIFRQDGAPHTLLLLTDVSLPLQDEERLAWKRLIRVLGHELSNSLTPIKSIAGSLIARLDAMEAMPEELGDFRRGLNVVESRADALHRFVQSYRKLAQLPAPTPSRIDLGALLERVVLLEQRLPVQLLPGPSVMIDADSDQIEQMFINLMANAVDASQAAGTSQIALHWSVAGPHVVVCIDDRGTGIANPDNLFVPFYTTKPSGSGVGLALAQQIASAHGGHIQLINREDGPGVRATVRLPLPATSAN